MDPRGMVLAFYVASKDMVGFSAEMGKFWKLTVAKVNVTKSFYEEHEESHKGMQI
jgi:hypothetical protein